MGSTTFKFCAENITKPAGDYETLTIDKFNEDMVEVTRTIKQTHPDIRERNMDGKSDRKISTKFLIKNFGYKTVKEAIDYFNLKMNE